MSATEAREHNSESGQVGPARDRQSVNVAWPIPLHHSEWLLAELQARADEEREILEMPAKRAKKI